MREGAHVKMYIRLSVHDDLDKRGCRGTCPRWTHPQALVGVLMRRLVCVQMSLIHSADTYEAAIMCPAPCWDLGSENSGHSLCLWKLIVSWGDRRFSVGAWGTVW